ncbi:MAG: hypothetical protein HC916_16160 [Coleofasciculaceae cyanobacterium SM2_1_6]|nr:hypothetical protein [Coleofasciculaceae cyanobacterium SM2_1_6]
MGNVCYGFAAGDLDGVAIFFADRHPCSYSFWRLEGFEIVREFSLANFQAIAPIAPIKV